MKRNLLCILLICTLLLTLLPAHALAAEGSLPATLSVEPSEGNNLPAAIDLVLRDKEKNNGDYCLYLPGNANVSACFFSWEGDLAGTEGPRSYQSGAMPIPAVGESKTYYFSDGTQEASFTVTTYQGSSAVPPIFIEIDESKGTIAAMNADSQHETECTGIVFIDGEEFELDKMKGRGNATWSMAKEKRPYNITLGSKVSTILGIEMPEKTKKFSLLANIADRSLLRNKIGYDMSYAMGIGLDSASADVWMNGQYMGVYLVTPKNDSFITDDGYGLEDDNYTEAPIEQGGDPSFEVEGTVVPGGKRTRITVKKIGDNLLPDGETVASLKAATVPIREYVQEVWDAIRSSDGCNDKGKHYSEYVDMESWAAMYLMQEFVRGYDANAGSLLFYRDGTAENDRLYAGPMWDLDNAVGSNQGGGAHGVTLADASGWFLRNIHDDKGSIYQAIGKHEDFMDEVYRVYNENLAVFDEAAENVAALAKDLTASAEMNDVRITKETYNNAHYSSQTVLARGTEYEQVYKATHSWQDYVDNLETFVGVRAHFFRNNLTREDIIYRGRFSCAIGSSVTAFDTRDTSVEGTPNADFAFVRNGETGEPDSSGNGEINFRVDLKPGYEVAGLTAIPAANYGEILSLGEDLYRITNLSGTVTVNIATKENDCDHVFEGSTCTLCGANAFRAALTLGEGCSIDVFDTRELTGTPRHNPASVLALNGETGKAGLIGNGEVNFIASVPEGFRIGRITVSPEENYDKILYPSQTGTNGYRITGIRGDVTVSVEGKKLGDGVDFTNPASIDNFDIVNQQYSEIRPGEGLYMISTRNAFEPSSGQLSEFNPKDVVFIPVAGDWTATLHFSFDMAGASNGYYQYFGFYAMKDYNNFAGIRGGENAMQDMRRIDGTIIEEAVNSTPGLAENGEYWYRIEKIGTDYICWRSEDGETFTEMFTLEDTGIEAENLCIDAYTGMTEGWEYLLKELEIEYPEPDCVHDYQTAVTPPTCEIGGFTTYVCTLCGHSYTGDETAAAHKWDTGIITARPTEEKDGQKVFTCTACGETKTEILPAHRHSYLRQSISPTCTAPGCDIYTCACGDTHSYETTAALGHDFRDGSCTRCGETNAEHNCPGKSFSDMPAESNWAHKGIDYCLEKGLMNGTGDHVFHPGGTLTRAELVTVLYRVEGSPKVEYQSTFKDVTEGQWYTAAIEWAAANEIVKGVGDGSNFDPSGMITREQIATILYRYNGEPNTEGDLSAFPDANSVSPYAVGAMLWANREGIINGISAGNVTKLAPQNSATREQIASIMMRYLETK